jgi:DNA replication protein DnaC
VAGPVDRLLFIAP